MKGCVYMLRIIFGVVLIFTIAYWIGYHVGCSTYDLRPVCFIVFGNALETGSRGFATTYWGYEDRPNCDLESLQFFGARYNGTEVYFLIERNTILKEAEGQKITAVLNMGRYSKKRNARYMAFLVRTGKRIILDNGNDGV